MNEHEQLKEICDKIGYNNRKINKDFNKKIEARSIDGLYIKTRNIDVREIIFTQEFMDKFEKKYGLIEAGTLIRSNLNNPTEYLYNLIK